MVTVVCRDLPSLGITLLPPSHAGFAEMAADIRSRYGESFPTSIPASAILVNHGAQPLAALAFEWQYQAPDGSCTTSHLISAFGRSLLLPFGARPEQLAIYGYWNTILPGSKRLIVDTVMLGDNRDVRPPAESEQWHGGSGVGGGSHQPGVVGHVHSATLTIDGAFSSDGQFAGPNLLHLWDDIYYEAQVRMDFARAARHLAHRGGTAEEVAAALLDYIGPPAGVIAHDLRPEHFVAAHRSRLAESLQHLQTLRGSETLLRMLIGWLDLPRPSLRRT